jgi:hypothetical protein
LPSVSNGLPAELSRRPLSTDSVEKLCRRVHRVSAARNDLSDRPRIDDRDSAKGLITPADVPKRAALEFFNRIDHKRFVEAQTQKTASNRQHLLESLPPKKTFR